MLTYGVDLSYANGSISWPQAKFDDRVAFAGLRVCYGDIVIDDDGPVFTTNHDAAKAHGIPTFCYLFFLAWHDGAAQARHFLQQANGRYGDWWPAIDVEEGSFLYGGEKQSLDQRISNLAACSKVIEDAIGRPMICTNPDTWKTYFNDTDGFAGHGLYLMEYDVVPGTASPLPGLPNLWVHQYSDGRGESPISGMSKPDNNVDRDVLMVDSARMRRV